MNNSKFTNKIKLLARPLYRALKYRFRLKYQTRQNNIYSQFFRFPNQYKALDERIFPWLFQDDKKEVQSLNIAMFGCCTGDELYSLASEIQRLKPGLEFHIHAFDIVEDLVNKANSGVYSQAEVKNGPFVTSEFLERTFDEVGQQYKVKEALKERTSCEVADILDESLLDRIGKCDFVFAQNVLFHLPPKSAEAAFGNLVRLMKNDRSVLFVNGMDTPMRVKLTKYYDLDPLDYLVKEIHEDARIDRGDNWANHYWGREPFVPNVSEGLRKFGTIYYKEKIGEID